MNAFTLLRTLCRRFPGLLVGSTALLILEGLFGVLAVFSLAPLIDLGMSVDLQQGSAISRQAAGWMRTVGLPVSLGGMVVVYLVIQALKSGLSILSRHVMLRTKYAILRDLILGTFDEFFHARWLFFSSQQQGRLLNTFLREFDSVGEAFWAMALFCSSVVQLILYLSVAVAISWQVTSLSLAMAAVLVLPLVFLGRVSYRYGRQNTATGNQIGIVIQESLGMAKVILGFGNQRKSLQDLERVFDAHRRVTVPSQTLKAGMPLMYEPFAMVVLAVALLTARRLAIPLSEVAVLLWALRCGIPLVGSVTTQRNLMAHLLPSYEQIHALREEAKALRQPSGARVFTALQREVVVDRVSVAYPGQAPCLSDVTMRIPKGRMIAVVGESGSGKSTLIDTIMGFHPPAAGRVSVDGVPLEAFDVTSYRQRIGYVPQDSVLFNATIRENLRWANPAATDAEIHSACCAANADEFVTQFRDGYDTVVGDRGVRLSGGQCQRVALARAILRKPDLLILDEATSALDTHSERLIQQAIERVAKDTTVIVVAHRLSTIVKADYVYVVSHGRVIEEGGYQELVRRQGHFSRMTQMQMLETAAS